MCSSAAGENSRDWQATIGRLRLETDRVARRLRGLSQPRLAASLPPYGTVAEAGRQLAQALADGAEGVAAGSGTPSWRTVPILADVATGDQVAVTAADLLETLELAAPDAEAWTRGGRTTVARLAADLLALAHRTKLAID